MTIELALLISILSVAGTLFYASRNSKRADTADIARAAAESATINTKLDQIGIDVRDIKRDMATVKKDVQELTERVIIVEQSAKSAHHRLDSAEEREGKK